jgi:hypothetical protein
MMTGKVNSDLTQSNHDMKNEIQNLKATSAKDKTEMFDYLFSFESSDKLKKTVQDIEE